MTIRKFPSRGMVLRGSAPQSRCDVDLGESKAVAPVKGLRSITKSRFVQSSIKKGSGGIAGKHPAGPIRSKTARGEPQD